ncbi:MAG: hypothetical protein M0Q90_04305 [Bacteroidales bacterium]|nr:hypothetical protein [Bacteroidales bacterium]
MKTITRLALYFVLLTIFSSCASILGIKNPEKKTRTEVLAYLQKHDIDTTNTVFIKPEAFELLKSQPFKPGWEAGFRPIQCKLFDADGQLVFQYSSCEGSLKNTAIETQFPPRNITAIDSSYRLQDELELIQTTIPKLENSQAVAVIYWATYTGIPGRNLIKKVTERFKKHEPNIVILKLNTDLIKEE